MTTSYDIVNFDTPVKSLLSVPVISTEGRNLVFESFYGAKISPPAVAPDLIRGFAGLEMAEEWTFVPARFGCS
ncbi:MAG: hypothetical protein CVU57_04495 [Deltaproteobacteria bacterium HGW-Deltaproteobacteria-15]|jgi:hypothetical protein|nr:MAG: hypothetical protein CVU57_04495 [Deltaproteobacteria bacterium HGW-Deltaproteobacteria-15]